MSQQLIWNLAGIVYKEQAVNFLKRFEESLCVFSGTVEQVYANYNIWPVTADSSKLLVLPNAQAHHDTYQDVSNEAVVKTGLFIVPGEAIGKAGLLLAKRNPETGKFIFVPFASGLKKVAEKMPDAEPFLPVITNKDLRELNKAAPILHLHRVKPSLLKDLSRFDANSLQHTIQTKMDRFLLCA
ncbi:hypothetical protein R50072_15930 [Simiduia litorea]|uniref:hypothetical protein n=1 Tax=Simiduia litorea TaxID=1435348 RepID=UPI0036F40652